MENVWNALIQKINELGFVLQFEEDFADRSVNGHFNSRTSPATITMYNVENNHLDNVLFLAHETGHGIHMLEFPTQKAYQKGYDEDFVGFEEIAWERAASLLKTLGFHDWEAFHALRDTCLHTYQLVKDGNLSELLFTQEEEIY